MNTLLECFSFQIKYVITVCIFSVSELKISIIYVFWQLLLKNTIFFNCQLIKKCHFYIYIFTIMYIFHSKFLFFIYKRYQNWVGWKIYTWLYKWHMPSNIMYVQFEIKLYFGTTPNINKNQTSGSILYTYHAEII